MTTLESLEARLIAQEDYCEVDRTKLYALIERNRLAIETSTERNRVANEALKDLIDTKVDWKQFWAVVGILTTILSGLMGIIYVQLKELTSTTNRVENNVSYMSGVFKNSGIEVQK